MSPSVMPRRATRSLLLAAFLAPAAAGAQDTAAAAAAPSSNPAVSTVGSLYRQASGYVLRAAEQAPDSVYAFRPVEGVRTFGQLVGHVAQAHHMICSAALGESMSMTENIEETRTTKAALVEALRASGAVCERAFGQSDAEAAQPTRLFGQEQSRLWALNLVAAHDWEHYGNLVTYMRINGMVPPSSQPSGGN